MVYRAFTKHFSTCFAGWLMWIRAFLPSPQHPSIPPAKWSTRSVATFSGSLFRSLSWAQKDQRPVANYISCLMACFEGINYGRCGNSVWFLALVLSYVGGPNMWVSETDHSDCICCHEMRDIVNSIYFLFFFFFFFSFYSLQSDHMVEPPFLPV